MAARFTPLFILLCAAATTSLSGQADTTVVHWSDALPACPCTAPDHAGTVANDGWALEQQDSTWTIHTGYKACYRSYPAVETAAGRSGQQCCYNFADHLITSGGAAGTPLKVSACTGEDAAGVMVLDRALLPAHRTMDLVPFHTAPHGTDGSLSYAREWPPNAGRGCPVVPSPHNRSKAYKPEWLATPSTPAVKANDVKPTTKDGKEKPTGGIHYDPNAPSPWQDQAPKRPWQ